MLIHIPAIVSEVFVVPLRPELLLVAATATMVLMVIVLFLLFRRRRRPVPAAPPRPAPIDVTSLDASGPPPGGPSLEFYGTPVRLAALVLAPVGREGEFPSASQLPEVFEHLLPRLMEVVAAQQPLLQFWPQQLSSQGFTNAFFNNVSLPGERGKGTVWCSAAGKFSAVGRQFLAGLVCCAERDNGLGQFVIEHEGQWNDILRVRS